MSTHSKKLLLLPVILAMGLSQARQARAEGDKATAEALFADGRRLMAEGDYTAACSKFEASQRLDEGVGTMLNLAECYEKLGRTASAWAEFREAASKARSAGAKGREQMARARAEALEKRLARLTLVARGVPAGLRIVRDGLAVERAALGTAVPIDPGRHVIEAESAGKKKWSTVVDVREGAQLTIEVPELSDERAGPAKPPPPLAALPPPTSAPPSDSSGTTQRGIAIGASVVGVAGVVVGAIFGLKAQSTWEDAKQECPTHPDNCASGAVTLGERASDAAVVSTIGAAVGIIGLAGGAALWLTAPSSRGVNAASASPVRVGVSGQRMLVQWSFE